MLFFFFSLAQNILMLIFIYGTPFLMMINMNSNFYLIWHKIGQTKFGDWTFFWVISSEFDLNYLHEIFIL